MSTLFKIGIKKVRGKLKFHNGFLRTSVIGLKNWLMHAVSDCKLWYYGLSSFQVGGTKLKRCLPKNQYTVFPQIVVSSLE